MRAFIAIPLSQNIKGYLYDIQKQFKECSVYAKWVNAQNIHLTLKFLGEVKEEKVPFIRDAIKETAVNSSVLRVNFTNCGFFPNTRSPRVFFIATDKEAILQKIVYGLEEKLEPLGFKREHRFKSHITLARLKSKKNISCLRAISKEIIIDKPFLVNSIILYKSTITQQGPIYEEIFSAEFSE